MIKIQKDLFASPYKKAEGNFGNHCKYPYRLDTYGKGCHFNCKYCYAKKLLNFRGLWKPENPAPASIKQIIKIIKATPSGSVLKMGGMSDCLQPKESAIRITYNTIRLLNKKRIHYIIVTKNDMITRKEYIELLDPELAHIQISIPSTSQRVLDYTDHAPSYERRKTAVETLQEAGYDTTVRYSPVIDKYTDYKELNNIKCDKILLDFLRVTNKITADISKVINPDEFTEKYNNFRHYTLQKKLDIIKKINYKQISVCEEIPDHHQYFKEHINYNPDDCCNLTLE